MGPSLGRESHKGPVYIRVRSLSRDFFLSFFLEGSEPARLSRASSALSQSYTPLRATLDTPGYIAKLTCVLSKTAASLRNRVYATPPLSCRRAGGGRTKLPSNTRSIRCRRFVRISRNSRASFARLRSYATFLRDTARGIFFASNVVLYVLSMVAVINFNLLTRVELHFRREVGYTGCFPARETQI